MTKPVITVTVKCSRCGKTDVETYDAAIVIGVRDGKRDFWWHEIDEVEAIGLIAASIGDIADEHDCARCKEAARG